MVHNQSMLQPMVTDNREDQNTLDSVGSEVFQIFFLKNDKNRSVEVVETPTIPLNELIERLKDGESVFLTYKSAQTNQNLIQRSTENLDEPWYFTRV